MKKLCLLLFIIIFTQYNLYAQEGWSWQNPYPTGNNLNSVDHLNESTAVIVGCDGIILRTDDGGESWITINSGTTNQLNEVFFADPDVGFAVGNDGMILKTTDSGNNWLSLTDTISNNLLDVCFVDASIGTVVGSDGLILRTTDGGMNWITQYSGTTDNLNSVCFIDALTGWTVGGNSEGSESEIILKTSDGGINWTQQTSEVNGEFIDVCFTDSLTGYCGNHRGWLIKTTDGGENWLMLPTSSSSDIISLCFIDSNYGYYATTYYWTGSGKIAKTTDGGNTWSTQSSCHELKSISFADSNNGIAVGDYGSILRTTDGGENWDYNYVTRLLLTSVSFIDEYNGLITAQLLLKNQITRDKDFVNNQWHDILKTTDGGASWNSIWSDSLNNMFPNSISYIDYLTYVVVGMSGAIYRSTDGGISWEEQISGMAHLYDVCFTNLNHGTAVGTGGLILNTTNGGTTWIQQKSGTTARLNGVGFIDSQIGMSVGSDGTILKTTNGGENWQLLLSGTNEELLDVSFKNSNNSTAVGKSGKILRTTDGGLNWISQSNGMIANTNLRGVCFTDSLNGTAVGHPYSASGIGTILKTTDAGSTWTEQEGVFTKGLYDVYFVNTNTGWAVGFDGTILKTTNGGATFVDEKKFDEIPDNYTLNQNYPNPFNPNTKLRYSIPRTSSVEIRVYDILGREIKILFNEEKPIGNYEVKFDASELPSGVYFYRLQAGDFVETKKMLLLK